MVTTDGPQEDVVVVPEAPIVPGLSFQRLSGQPDFKILADVIQRSRDADLYDLVETPEDIANGFRHLQNCDPSSDMFLVEVKGKLVGFCSCEWHERRDGVRTYEHNAHLVPEWRVKGLRQVMLRENERRLREISARHPREYAKFFEVRTNSEDNHWKALVEEEGYQPFRHNLLMVRSNLDDIPGLPMPGGLEVRPVRSEHHRIIFRAAEEAFRDEPNFAEEMWTEEGLKAVSEWRMFRPEIWQVAWDGSKVAGAVLNFIDLEENRKFNRNWGYTMVIFVRRPYRNRGLASALIARSFEVLRKEGVSKAALMVDFENPSGARRLYEKWGYRLFEQFTRYRKPLNEHNDKS